MYRISGWQFETFLVSRGLYLKTKKSNDAEPSAQFLINIDMPIIEVNIFDKYWKKFAESLSSSFPTPRNRPNILKSHRQCTYNVNPEALSCSHCCRGKAISIVYCQCVSVALAKLLNCSANRKWVHTVPQWCTISVQAAAFSTMPCIRNVHQPTRKAVP